MKSRTNRSPADELEQRLVSEADAWVEQYEQAGRSQTQQVSSGTQDSESDTRFRIRSRNRQMMQVITLLTVCLVFSFGLRFLWTSNTQQTVSQQENPPEDLKQKEVEIRSVIAYVRAVNKICDRVVAGIRRQKASSGTWQIDINAESSLVNAARHLKQPGRQYGRSLAWIGHRLQLVNPDSKHNTSDRPN